MKKPAFLLFALSVTAAVLSFVSPGKIPNDIPGYYDLYNRDDPSKGVVAYMIITDWGDNNFLIRGNGWIGSGTIINNEGYYDWKFDDGKKGRTTFMINTSRQLEGHVVGSGIDWYYVGKKKN